MNRCCSADVWMAELEHHLEGHDVFARADLLERSIARLDAWLEAYPDAEDRWYELFEELVDRHAATLEQIALLRSGAPVEVAVRLPAHYKGPVGSTWHMGSNGECVAWFTPEELEVVAWAHAALCQTASNEIYCAA
ncbi:MAG: hypothetical protein Q9O62_01885 [Ardenticatenia bacterium]|nr:hypothetical protein [Ardenticatenia bacterium]